MTTNVHEMAVNQAEAGRTYYGKISVHAEALHFAGGGASPEPYDSSIHTKRPSIKTEFSLNPIDDQADDDGITFAPSTNTLSFTEEWKKHIWPSLKALNLAHAGELEGKWAKVEEIKTGGTWTSKSSGKEHDNTTWKFHAVYDTHKECVDAYLSDRGVTAAPVDPVMDIPMGDEVTKPEPVSAATSADTIAQFAPALVMAAQGNMDVLDASLKSLGVDHTHPAIQSELQSS